jgi:hypothetical protein
MKKEGLFNEPNLILGGDLNFTTLIREVWGELAKADPLQIYFSQMIQDEGLVDVELAKLLPSSRNGRCGKDYIDKRLDMFLLDERLAPFLVKSVKGAHS